MSGKSVDFKVDSGAEMSVLRLCKRKLLTSPPSIRSSERRIVSYSGEGLGGNDRVPVQVAALADTHVMEFFVILTQAPPILGLQDYVANQARRQRLHAVRDEPLHPVVGSNAGGFGDPLGLIECANLRT